MFRSGVSALDLYINTHISKVVDKYLSVHGNSSGNYIDFAMMT